jgi:hypothetical protein
MTSSDNPGPHHAFIQTVRRNCDLSDARDNGIYSLCSLILKLRGLYKWEHGLEPWDEPESSVVLEWIEEKETYWETLAGAEYQPLALAGRSLDPFAVTKINNRLTGSGQIYGAGYGRSLKAIFFLAELREERSESDCRILILGHETARELAAPFAMRQENVIIIRREPLRFFFWDQIQEIRSTSRAALRHALALSGVQVDPTVDRQGFRDQLDAIVDREIPAFIHHEIGELRESALPSQHLQQLIAAFPASPIELAARAVKDALADTHPEGMLGYILATRAETSLGFYAGFLDGIRGVLQPEIIPAFANFLVSRDWRVMEEARLRCRQANLLRAAILGAAAESLASQPAEQVKARIEREILLPLGI